MSNPVANPAAPKPRRFWPLFPAAAAIALVTIIACMILLPRPPRPPAVATSGVDPTVAKLIEKALDDVRATPRSGAAWGRLGSVLMHYEFIGEAGFAFDEAERASPMEVRWPYLHGLLLLTHDGPAAIVKLQRAVAACPDTPDIPRVRLAQFLAERGRESEAESHFKTLLQRTPNHPLAMLGLARLRQTQGRLSESTNYLSACLNNPHTARSAHVLLATVQQALGNASAAEAAARRGASLPADAPWPDPFWQEAAVYRVGRKAMLDDASALLDQQRFPEAMQVLNKVARDYPEDDEAWYQMGWALNQSRQNVEAERALREHLQRSPQSPKGHAQLAVALLGQRRYADAIEVLTAAVKLKPTWRELHSNLGYACVQLGRHDDAIRHFRDALNCDPNYAGSYTALADLLSRRGDTIEARQLLRYALDLNPSDARARALLDGLAPAR